MSIISAGTSSSTAVKVTGNTDGTLVLKTNDTGSGGTTALTLATNQAATFASSVSATAFSGPLNGTVGATTPNTGAFTTVTTSSTITANVTAAAPVIANRGDAAGAIGHFFIQRAGTTRGYYGTNASDNTGLYDTGTMRLEIVQGSGVAVTGTITASNTVTVTPGNGVKGARISGSSNTLGTDLVYNDAGDTVSYINNAYAGNTNSKISIGFGTTYGSNEVLTLTKGGTVAVTGTLSATGAVTFTGAGTEQYRNTNATSYLRLANDSTGAAADSQFYIQNSASTYYIGVPSTGFTTSGLKVANTAYHYFDGAGGLNIGATNGAGVLRFYTGGTTERMRLDSSGSLLLNTTTDPTTGAFPRAPLSIKGLSASAFAGIQLEASADQSVLGIGYDGSYFTLSTSYRTTGAYRGLQISVTNGTPTATFTTGGALCVGQTSAGGGANVPSVAVKSATAGDQCLALWNAATSGTRYLAYFGVGSTFTATGSITSDGSTTAYNTTSDYRLKENVQPMTGALARVMALKPCVYQWKSDGSEGEGFIAHELAQVFPQAVSGEKDAMRVQSFEISPAIPATYDEDGNELTPAVEAVYEDREVPAYQGIDTSFLVATLTAAIQELNAKVAALEAKNAPL